MFNEYRAIQENFKGERISIYQTGSTFSDAGHAFQNVRPHIQSVKKTLDVASTIATEQDVLFDRKTKTFYRDYQGDSPEDIIDCLVDAYLSLEAYVINQAIL